MHSAWRILRPPNAVLCQRPVRRMFARAMHNRDRRQLQALSSGLSGFLSRIQEKAKQLRKAAVVKPFKWEKPGKVSLPSIELTPPDVTEGGSIASAVKAGSVGFGFSAGGVLEGLQSTGLATGELLCGQLQQVIAILSTENTQMAGSSAGSILAVCQHSGLSTDIVAAACLELAQDCRENGSRGRLGDALSRFLNQLLPDDIHERCKGRAFIAVTRAFPRPRGELITECTSKADLIETVLTSCHIPWWFDTSLTHTYRGHQYYDGGLTNFIPVPPDVQAGVRVCCFPSKQISSIYRIQISPDNFEEWPYSMTEMLGWAFEPAEEKVLKELISKGRADAEAWALQSGAAAALETEDTAKAGLQEERYPSLKT